MINEVCWAGTTSLVVNIVTSADGHGCFGSDLAVVVKANSIEAEVVIFEGLYQQKDPKV